MAQLYQMRIGSPLGALRLIATDMALAGLYFPEHRHAPQLHAADAPDHPVLLQAAAELAQYFRGARRVFAVPLATQGTEFQRTVWRELALIPFGERCTYSGLAARLGRRAALRAVGAAIGRNPLSIFIPCHRVVGADGSLTGYAGGIDAKHRLLAHEQAVLRCMATAAGQQALF